VTKQNVGPWGLSAVTERRPMYLSPQLMTTVPLPHGTAQKLTSTLARLDAEDQVVNTTGHSHSDLVHGFLGPLRKNPLVELAPGLGRGRGRGLFSNSQVWVTESVASAARQPLSGDGRSERWTLPDAVNARPIEINVSGRRLRMGARVPAKARKES
jgi:hypothetical protein